MGSTDDDRLEGMLRWLQTAEARAAAASELSRRGLGMLDADDLVNDVVLRLARAELPADLRNPVAYARRSLTMQATDLLRGERVVQRRRAAVVVVVVVAADGDDGLGPLVDVADPDAVDPSVDAALAGVEADLRRALHRRIAVARVRVWAVAAALTTLTLRVHRDVALPAAAPEPEVGSPAKADRWAALWLAGEHDVFPDEERVDDQARRKARSRKLQEVERLLADVAATVLGGDVDG